MLQKTARSSKRWRSASPNSRPATPRRLLPRPAKRASADGRRIAVSPDTIGHAVECDGPGAPLTCLPCPGFVGVITRGDPPCRLRSCCRAGSRVSDAPLVTVEVHLAGGLPAFNLVGLPDTEVKESRDRVRAALQNAQFEFPARKITVNLAPADLPKESGRYDLPIAVGGSRGNGTDTGHGAGASQNSPGSWRWAARCAVRGALPMALSARRDGRAFVLPAESAAEAVLVRDATVYPASSLLAVCGHLTGRGLAHPLRHCPRSLRARRRRARSCRRRGQAHAKRALTIAAAGAHSLLIL